MSDSINNPAVNQVEEEEVVTAAVSGGRAFYVNAPAEVHQAVMVDYILESNVEKTKPGTNEKYTINTIKFVFQLATEITQEDVIEAARAAGVVATENDFKQVGKRFLIYSPDFNLKLSEQRADKQTDLTKFTAQALGARVADKDIKTFNFAKLLGRNFQIVSTLEAGKKDPSKLFPKIAAIMPWKKGDLIEAKDFTRRKDREKAKAAAEAAKAAEASAS
jgi:hypothetical protein